MRLGNGLVLDRVRERALDRASAIGDKMVLLRLFFLLSLHTLGYPIVYEPCRTIARGHMNVPVLPNGGRWGQQRATSERRGNN